MAESHTYRLISDTDRQRAARACQRAPQGWFVQIGEPTRTLEQNAKLWPMLVDVQRQVPDCTRFSTEDAKLRFMHALGSEMRMLPDLENAGFFPVGYRSSKLTKSQFSGLIDLIGEYGARHGVRWSDERKAAA